MHIIFHKTEGIDFKIFQHRDLILMNAPGIGINNFRVCGSEKSYKEVLQITKKMLKAHIEMQQRIYNQL